MKVESRESRPAASSVELVEGRSTSLTAGANARSALTLIELLIVIIILTTLVSAAIPILAPTNDDRRLREASRNANAFITGAQMKAIETQRPHGVMIKRLSQDTNAAGNPGDAHEDNAVSVELFYVEQPSPFVGFAESSSVRISLEQDVAGGNGVRLQFVRRGTDPTNDYLPFGWDYDLLPPATIRIGDIVEVAGTRYQLTDTDVDALGFYRPNSGEPDGELFAKPVNDTGQLVHFRYPDLDTTSTEREDLIWTEPLPYKILRQPMQTSAEPLQLPDGTAIDLRASGVGTSDYFHVPNSVANFRDNREPIVIMFAPEGRVSRVRYAINPANPSDGLVLFDQPVVDNIFLLVGRRENAPPPGVGSDPTLDSSRYVGTEEQLRELKETVNWLRSESRWIAIGAQSGRVVTVENAFVDPQAVIAKYTPPPYSLTQNSEPLRTAQIHEAREFAREMTQAGGR